MLQRTEPSPELPEEPGHPPVVWSPTATALWSVLVIGLSVLVPIALVAAAFGQAALYNLTSQPGIATLVLLGSGQVIMALGAVLLALRGRAGVAANLGLVAARSGWRDYALASAVIVALPLVVNAIRYYGLGHDIFSDLKQLAGFFRTPLWPLSFVIIAIGAPLAEELLFRGFLLRGLARSRLGFWGAAVVSTAVFTALHTYSLAGMLLVVAMGLWFSWLLRRSGSLWVPMTAHAVNNTLACLYLQFGPALP